MLLLKTKNLDLAENLFDDIANKYPYLLTHCGLQIVHSVRINGEHLVETRYIMPPEMYKTVDEFVRNWLLTK